MNKTIVITGGSGGLGKRLMRLFLNNGDNVCSLSRSNDEGFLNYFYCDVKDGQSVESAIEKVALKFKKIDILICNSGIGLAGAISNTPLKKVKSVIDVNFYGVLNTVKSALKYMDNNGKIIAVSSASAFFAVPYRSIYSLSKAAVNILMFSLSMELKGTNIKVSAICPGEIDTDFVKNRLWHIEENAPESHNLKSVSQSFEKKQKSRMNADTAANKIYKIINKKNLLPLYIIGAKYKLFYFAGKILPLNLFLKITDKLYGGKGK